MEGSKYTTNTSAAYLGHLGANTLPYGMGYTVEFIIATRYKHTDKSRDFVLMSMYDFFSVRCGANNRVASH